MRAQLPQVFPQPREQALREGSLAVAPGLEGERWLNGLPSTVADAERRLASGESGPFRLERDAGLPAEGYALEILPTGVRVGVADARGALHAANTLRQLREAGPAALPCLEIRDHPDLAARGFMLDVSRGKVPTLAELLRLAEAMARLRLNQLQLYVEHSFAFPGHDVVWREASPLTPGDLAALGARCAELGIELVPNLNTFGHLERWLRHEPYRRLAECPDGWTHPLTGLFKPHPSTLCPDDRSLRFVEGLLDAYLPHFASAQVNIGGDEPWELGQGRSREAVAARGKHRVYLDFLNRIHGLVRARGKRMLFWGDILLEDLALAAEAPREALPVVWGYDPGHPFDVQCGRLAELGRDYLVAPGTGAWQSLTGRLEDARVNAREAVDAALRHGAGGVLVTAWGDSGTHQPWPTFWAPLADAAAMAWCRASNARPDTARGLRAFVDNPADAAAVAGTLESMGGLDSLVAHATRNRSLSWDLLTAEPASREALRGKVAPAELEASLARLGEAAAKAAAIGDARVRAELALGIDLARAGFVRPDDRGLRALEARYREAWLLRARPGGLDESVGLLRLA